MRTYEDNAASDDENDENKENKKSKNKIVEAKKPLKLRSLGQEINIEWMGKPLGTKGDKKFYSEVKIENEVYRVGDGALFRYADDNAVYVRR